MEARHTSSAVLRVFLSSTFVDLQAHRAAVRDIVERLGQFTLAMEQFGAREGDAQTVSTELVAGCDLYLGVIAWRYGYVPAEQNHSVTHLEYEEAGRLGIPRLVFLAAPDTQAADGPTDLFPAAARDPEHLEQLLAFRAEIERAQVVDYFTTPNDLAKKVAAALYQYLQAHPTEQGARPPRDLPPRAPGFVGHEEDLQAVCSSLRQEQSVAVVGMGGLGKSSLAAEAVHMLSAEPEAFAGGITWVRCDDRTGLDGLTWIDDQLLAAWGAALPAEATARAATPAEGLALRERALQKRFHADASSSPAPALVLLDNLESGLALKRLLETVQPLGVTLLLTMRSEPASPRVHLLRLEVLPSDAGVQLFAERYAARGGAWFAERDEVATRAIVDALGGLPLAIELAAARAARARLSLATLADELRTPEVLAKLTDPLDPSASVHYSLSKTLAGLSHFQQIRFATLGLPEGPDWPLPVVERMLEDVPTSTSEAPEGSVDAAPSTSARADLDALVAYSLVALAAAEGTETQRVRLHPLVRELAREEWAHQGDVTQRAALAGLLSGVNRWVAEHRQAVPVLEHDIDLIVAAVRAAAEQQVELPLAFDTVQVLATYLLIRDASLGVELRTLQVQMARAMDDRLSELTALRALASASQWTGQIEARRKYLGEALDLARELDDITSIIQLLCAIASLEVLNGGSLADARGRYDDGCAMVRSMGEQSISAAMLVALGDAASTLGYFADARDFTEQALVRYRAEGDMFNVNVCLHNLGDIAARMDDDTAARAYHGEELANARELLGGAEKEFGVTYDRLGEIELRAGNLELAAHYLQEALRQDASVNDSILLQHYRANLLMVQGEVARLDGDLSEAVRLYQEALAIFESAPTPYNHNGREYIASPAPASCW